MIIEDAIKRTEAAIEELKALRNAFEHAKAEIKMLRETIKEQTEKLENQLL